MKSKINFHEASKSRGVNTLNPYNRNSRTHSDLQIEQIAESIRQFGFTQPILISPDGTVIAGHGRLAAAKLLGLKEVPTIELKNLTEDQRRAYVIADNKIALNAGWDDDILKSELEYLSAGDFDMGVLGFSDDELMDLLPDPDGDGDDRDRSDEVPPLPAVPKSKPGELFQLGQHRLLCGDSTKWEMVEKLLDGELVDVVFTDPPYNLQERGQVKRTNKAGSKKNVNFGDWDVGFKPLDVLPHIDAACKAAAHRFVCTSSYLFGEIHSWFEGRGDKTNYLVWAKNNPMPSLTKANFVQATELIVHSRKGSPVFHYPAGENLPNVFKGNVEPHEFGHPSQKPTYVVDYCIGPTEGTVLDLFGGSGTTLIACEKTARKCFMMEFDPKYIDVIIERWEKFTGQKAIKLDE